MNSISNENDAINSAFFNANSGAYTMYTLNLTAFYKVMNQCQIKIAGYFDDIVTHGNNLVTQIIGA